MATVIEQINALKPHERFCSFEFFPPKTDAGFRNLLARLHRMMALNPLFLSITWGAGGSTSEKSLDLAATCQKELGVTTVLHLTCTNTNKEVIDHALRKAKEANIRNILALRGDPPRTEEYWTPNCDFKNAVDLVRYIKEQYGDYFCIGVAGYAEGHADGADTSEQDPAKDIPYLEEKVKAGADFIITQLFFDVDKFVAYESMLQQNPILKKAVLIPGLMPITTFKVFVRATKLSHALVPPQILERVAAPGNDDDMVKAIGIDIVSDMIEQVHTRTEGRIRGYHFYTLNLEKSVASIVEKSPVLNATSLQQGVDHDDAIDSDSDFEGPIPVKQGRNSFISENLAGTEDARLVMVSRAISADRKKIVDISKGKGLLGKDATWDDFPNGRFGDSNSPAYGEIDGYGPTLKLRSSEEVMNTWGCPETHSDITKVFMEYLSGKISVLPWVDSEISSETALIQEELFDLNQKGWFTLASQPAVNGCSSADKILGWGPPNGRLFQKAFVEFFIPKDTWNNSLYPRLKDAFDERELTYFCGDSNGTITSNLDLNKNSQSSKTAVTWGVFPSKEVLQPTIIDSHSFKAWNEEAFLLWIEWARCYKKGTKSYELLNNIYNTHYLVSIIHHDFTSELGLWEMLLEN
ncbi:hypothetical protein PUMCH_004430 [Australozyma saopauloensis]|uniref:MTHFR SAM-binding regulatory domain-containing protein n=1 Tax=Australozyma saopauloensis TaxID=291208 RepID=A0AAX4HET2_9ASCO|nr:hypothetical protein PUMCH_004430 [[Candida] saopauloensis]